MRLYRPNEPLGVLIFDTTDRFGKRIILEKSRYEEHIIDPETGHKELAGHEEAIINSVVNPYLVVKSNRHPDGNRFSYFGESSHSDNLAIKTIVDHSFEEYGFVVTSFLQSKRRVKPAKEGEVIYEESDES